jgi:hypothetical protein
MKLPKLESVGAILGIIGAMLVAALSVWGFVIWAFSNVFLLTAAMRDRKFWPWAMFSFYEVTTLVTIANWMRWL